MRRSVCFATLSTLVLLACSGGDAATSGDPSTPSTPSNAAGGASGDPVVDPGTVNGGHGGADAGSDAAPVVTADGCHTDVSPASDPCVLRDTIGVFASPAKGSDTTGDGTMASPFASAAKAIPFAAAHARRVFLCAEAYAEPLVVANGVSVFGGLDCSAAKFVVGTNRAHFAAPASPAATADKVQNTTVLEALGIAAPDAATPSGSSIGAVVTASPGLSLVNVWIHAGNAVHGADGANPANNVETGGIAGGDGYKDAVCTVADDTCRELSRITFFGLGGASSCGGLPGGSGGYPGYYVAVPTGGVGYAWSAEVVHGIGGGSSGANGAPGADGASAQKGVFTASGFTVGDGISGTNGGAGAGGAGSDGALPTVAATAGDHRFGLGGAGGGAGGCPGRAGTAGKGGGASIALLLNGSAIAIATSRFTSNAGGNGGRGTGGVAPTNGGVAGLAKAGISFADHGGSGGVAGASGSGAGGPSVAIAWSDGMPKLDATTALEPGTGGAGQAALTDNGKTIGASLGGETHALFGY